MIHSEQRDALRERGEQVDDEGVLWQAVKKYEANLGESTVVPNVPVVGEAVADIAEATLLDVLLDGVERLLLGDFHLGIGPAGNLDDHVENAIVPICKERDVMERRDDELAVLLDVDAVFCYILSIGFSRASRNDHMFVTESGHTERVGSADEPRSVCVFWERGLVIG